MIRVILTLCLFFVGANVYSQAPLIIRNDGKTTALDSNLFVGKSFRPPAFNDTTQANQSIKVLDSSGRVIFTRDSSTLWVRNVGKYWQKLVSGSGVVTLQQAFNAAPTANPDINAGGNTFLIAGDNNSGGVSRLIVGNNQGAQLYSKLDNIGYVNAVADGTIEISSSLAGSNSQKLVMNESKSYLVSGGSSGSDTSLTKLGVGTLYPEAPLDVSGAPRFRTDSAQSGYVWTAKNTSGEGEWRPSAAADSSVYFTKFRADTMRSNLYANKVPYTGATQDVDLGAFKLNAQAVHIKGTAGNGHLALKHQSAAATASGQETSIYANNNGDVAWKNDNLYITTIKTSGNTADRIYTFPDSSGTVALLSNVNAKQDTATSWKTGGNFNVNAGQFIGSNNNASFRFRSNGLERMVIDSTGNVNINQKVAGNSQGSNRLTFNGTGSTGNSQQGFIVYNGDGGASGGSLQLHNSNGSINLYPSNGDVYLAASSPQVYTTIGGPRFTNNSTSSGFIFGNYNTQSSGSLFSVKNTYTNPSETNPFTIFSNGNVKMGQIGVSVIDSGYAVDMTGNAVRISNTVGLSTPNSTALLDLTSTNRGLLIPRMTTTQRNSISNPATGLLIWNTNDTTVNQYTGNRWRSLASTDGQTFTDSLILTSTVGGISLPNMTQTQMNAITPRLGTQVYNTTYDAVCTFTNDFGWWSNEQPWISSNGWMVNDEFITYAYANNQNGNFFQIQNSNGTWTSATPLSNRPGILTMSTGTSATGRLTVQADGIALASNIVGGGKLIYEADVQIPTLSSAAQTFQFFTGFSSTNTNVSTNSIAFLYDSAGTNTGSAAIGRWQVVCANGSTRSYTTTDSTVTAGRWYRLRAEVNAAGNSVAFYINSALVKTETNNIPTGAVTPVTSLIKSVGTTARTAWLDFIRIRQKFTTPR